MEYKSLPYLGNDVAWMECNALPYQCIDIVVCLLNRMTILFYLVMRVCLNVIQVLALSR
jgi:hypothetical protein